MFHLMLQIAPDNPFVIFVIFLFFLHAEHCILLFADTWEGPQFSTCSVQLSQQQLPAGWYGSCTSTVWWDSPACAGCREGIQPFWCEPASLQRLDGKHCNGAVSVALSSARPGVSCAHLE